MAAIDLSGQTGLTLHIVFTDIDSTAVITIKDVTDTTTLGTLKLDQARIRPFVNALANVAAVYYPNDDQTPQGYKLTLDKNNDKGTVTFG